MVSLTLDDLFDDFADCSVSEWVDGWVVLRRATHEALQQQQVSLYPLSLSLLSPSLSPSLSLPLPLPPSPSLPPLGELQWDDDRNQLTGNIISSARWLATSDVPLGTGWFD